MQCLIEHLKSNINKLCKKPLKVYLHFGSVWDIADAFTQMFVTNFVKVNCKIQNYLPNVWQNHYFKIKNKNNGKVFDKYSKRICYFHLPDELEF